jgi:uncharacterized phage protein gp47/JayE
MAIIAKSIEDVMDDIASELVDPTDPTAESASIDDWNQGSKIKVQSRGFARVVSDCWRALVEVQRDSNPATARDVALDLLANIFGLYRKQGAQAVGFAIAIPKSNSAPSIAVNPGELLSLGDATFSSTGTVTLGSPYAVFPIQCTATGAKYNLPAGTVLTPLRSTVAAAYTLYVGNGLDARNNPVTSLSQGADREKDDAFRLRFGSYLLSLTRGTYKAVYTALAGISWIRSFALVEYLPMVGYMTAFIDDGSSNVTLTNDQKAEVLSIGFDWRCGGVVLRAKAMEKLLGDVTVNVTVDRTANVSVASVESAVQAYVTEQLSQWGQGQELCVSHVAAMAFQVENVVGATAAVVGAVGDEVPILPQQTFRPRTVTVHGHV